MPLQVSWSDFSENDNRQLMTSAWLYASATCLLFFDYTITFTREIELVWKSDFNLPTILYYLIRYVPFVTTWLTLFTTDIAAGATDASCTGLVRLVQSLNDVALIIFSVFTSLRIYAIWDKNYYLFVLLFLLGCFEPAANIFFSVHDEEILSAPKPLGACIAFLDSKVPINVYYIIPLATSGIKVGYEMLVLIFTLLKTFSVWRESRILGNHLSFSALIVRDGSIYFFVIASISILDIILREIKADSAFLGVASVYTPVLTPILYSRFIMDLRMGQKGRAATATLGHRIDDIASTVSTVQFQHDHIGRISLNEASAWGGYLEHTFGRVSLAGDDTSDSWDSSEVSEGEKGPMGPMGEEIGVAMTEMTTPDSEHPPHHIV